MTHCRLAIFALLAVCRVLNVTALSSSPPHEKGCVSVVTGASGYLGREIVTNLLDKNNHQQKVICLVRPSRVPQEEIFWKRKQSSSKCDIRVMPYDMLDGGRTLGEALDEAYGGSDSGAEIDCCVYHVASVFGPSEDHAQTALDNVSGATDVVKTIAKYKGCRLVLTSSMAAVRATGQEPSNGKAYTHLDWNTGSKLGDNWGSSYQWSKAESERQSWELAKELGVPMTSLCPSFVFGPPTEGRMSTSYSIKLVSEWVMGKSPVQSRLCVDVRDVAMAHVAAGTNPRVATNQRYIVSSEARLPSKEMAEALQQIAKETGLGEQNKITHDTNFDGGAIKIGEQEVVATKRLNDDLGVQLRPVQETMKDMGRVLLQVASKETSPVSKE